VRIGRGRSCCGWLWRGQALERGVRGRGERRQLRLLMTDGGWRPTSSLPAEPESVGETECGLARYAVRELRGGLAALP